MLLDSELRIVNDPCLVVPDLEYHRVHFGTSPATGAEAVINAQGHDEAALSAVENAGGRNPPAVQARFFEILTFQVSGPCSRYSQSKSPSRSCRNE